MIVNGMPYWTCTRYRKFTYVTYVIRFEPRGNKFKMLPKFVCASFPKYHFLIVNLKEGISALVYEGSLWKSLVDVYCLDQKCSIWSKMYTLDQVATFGGELRDDIKMFSHCFKYNNVVLFQARGCLTCFD